MTFSDIFKSSFLEKVTTFSVLDTAIALALSFVVGLFIYFVYKKTFNGVMYASSFGISLIGLSLITTLVILAVSSNVILSLGMVGALSIVRFRTAIKEPLDIVYLFWAIASGIVFGAGLIPLGVIGSLLIGIVLLVFGNYRTSENPYLLVVNCDTEETERQVKETVQNQVKKQMVKSKTVSSKGIEMTIEVRLKEMSTDFINRIASMPGVGNAVLVSYHGDYMG
ncbi:MAG: DUF4956 domain-containing protein [Clostridiales bacterium]|jgi:uncharacterized membrane protein YhiD involved in acid resistance|nr:DUF4956 domain-containing protein [Clostridiales bacterium]